MFNNVSRRDMLKGTIAGLVGGSVTGWFDGMAGHAAEAASKGVKHKSCILLWMNGGPSQAHTFDMKPGGEYKSIPTNVPGIHVCEYMPNIAKLANHLAVIRSMSTGLPEHRAGQYLMHAGFRKGGATTYPAFGCTVAKELGSPQAELPNFVSINPSSFAKGYMVTGYLGPRYAPLSVPDVSKGVENLKPHIELSDLDERARLLAKMDRRLQDEYQANPIEGHNTGYSKAMQLIHSSKSKAFDIASEPASLRAAYGSSKFGDGCMAARRLVEAGVPFVEISDEGKIWDTHKGAAGLVKDLCKPVEKGWATLITDLKDRGLLDSTLIVWMGEFGRSPGGGKGHFARAWSTVLCGGGIKTGQVVGRTDASGGTVEENPVGVGDFFATVAKALGINHTKQYKDKSGRPINLVDKRGKPIEQLF